MHGYVLHGFFIFSYILLHPHRDVIPAWSLCQSICGVPQFYPVSTDTDFRQSITLVLSSGLIFLEEVLTRTCPLSFHILSWLSCWKCLKSCSWQHLTSDSCCHWIRQAMGEWAPNQSWWELDLSLNLNLFYCNPRQMNLIFPSTSSGRNPRPVWTNDCPTQF